MVCPLLGESRSFARPVKVLADFLLAFSIDVIKGLEYAAPTSIQAQAIPAIMSGRDIIGVAKTGSGKTIAFLLPMFRHIKDQRPIRTMEGPIAMIMTPTRELATQIHKECKPFLKALGLRVSRSLLPPLEQGSTRSPPIGLVRVRRNASEGQHRRHEAWI